jgi:hypothetical protein
MVFKSGETATYPVPYEVPYPDAPDLNTLTKPPTFMESMKHGSAKLGTGITQGLMRVGEAVGIQPEGATKEWTEAQNRINAEYEARRGPDAGFDYGSLTGEILTTAPAGALLGTTPLGPLSQGLVGGAAVGATEFNPDTKEPVKSFLKNTAVGAGSGLVGTGVGIGLLKAGGAGFKVLGWGANKMAPIARKAAVKLGMTLDKLPTDEEMAQYFSKDLVGKELGTWRKGVKSTMKTLSDDVAPLVEGAGVKEFDALPDSVKLKVFQEAKRQIKVGEVNPAQLARVAIFESYGIKPTQSVLKQSATLAENEANLAAINKIGAPLRAAETKVAGGLHSRASRLAADMGGKIEPGEGVAVGQNVMDAVEGRWAVMQTEIGKIYDQVMKKYAGKPVLLAESQAFNAGMAKSSFSKRFAQVAESGDLNLVKRLRSDIQKAAKSAGGSERYDLMQLVDKIDEDVSYSLGDDVFSVGKEAAAGRFFEQQGAKIAKNIEADYGPAAIIRNIRNAKEPGEIRHLREVLVSDSTLLNTPEGVETLLKGKQAWKEIQTDAVSESILGAFQAGDEGMFVDPSKIKPLPREIIRELFAGEPAKQAQYYDIINMIEAVASPKKGVKLTEDSSIWTKLLQSVRGFFYLSSDVGSARVASPNLSFDIGKKAMVRGALSGSTVSPTELTRAAEKGVQNAIMPYLAPAAGATGTSIFPQGGR